MVLSYAFGYTTASWAGIDAAYGGHAWYAAALLTASATLLLAIHREYRHAAVLIRLVAAYRHHQAPGAGQAAIEYATALPPGCTCELWWITLGADHDAYCASTRKGTR
jgi:hypothetical protein